MWTTIAKSIKNHRNLWFLCSVLLFVNLYSFSTLTTKPAFWYDEAINVELARNFADFGELDLAIAPNTFSGKGATVGSTGYPVTVPLASFFKLFGFGLAEARAYMLLWMSACLVVLFFVARKLWGLPTAYASTLLVATFAPFYGNGRSVMGEIPGFLFLLLSFYFLERRKWWQSGVFLGLAVVSKPSVFLFLIPAYALTVLLSNAAWKERILNLMTLGASSLLALLPWFIIYADEISRGGLGQNLLAHFQNPYREAGASVLQNIGNNLSTLLTSTTLLYIWSMLAAVIIALASERTLFSQYKNLFLIAAGYFPLALLQYLKSFGYLRYLIAAELLIFILFTIAFPVIARRVLAYSPFSKGSGESASRGISKSSVLSDSDASFKKGGIITGVVLAVMILIQTVHLFWFSDIYPSEKTQYTLAYLSREYPDATIGVFNVPQVASIIPANRKYQYLSTYGLWQFGVNPLYLSPEKRPQVLVFDSVDGVLTADDKIILSMFYEEDVSLKGGFLVYRRR